MSASASYVKVSRRLKKYRTYQQVQTAQERAIRFSEDVLRDDDLASELESLTPEGYADRRGIEIVNPPERRTNHVANGNGATKGELQNLLDQVEQILTDVYQPESSREDLAGAIGDALAAIQGDEDEDEDEDDNGGADSD